MGYHQHSAPVIAARLQAAASRLAGWDPPVGDGRTRAVAELREIATIRPKPRRGTPHQPPAMVREDLLAEAAGLLLGTAPPTHPQAHRAAAKLLIEAGADRSLLDHWTNVGLTRAAGAECALMNPASGGRWP